LPSAATSRPENVDGAVGKALRFDGYTSHIDARLGNILPSGSKKLTVSVWVALPCYPIIQIDTDTSEKTAIVTCLNTDDKTGFGFYVGFNGKYSFRTYIGGWPAQHRRRHTAARLSVEQSHRRHRLRRTQRQAIQ